MADNTGYNALLKSIDAIATCRQTLVPAPDATEETRALEQAVNRLLARLCREFEASDTASDSLAAASIRMILLADIQARLNKADKRVKTTQDLKEFLEDILVDLMEVTGACKAVYATIDGQGRASSLLAQGVDAAWLDELRVSPGLAQLAASLAGEGGSTRSLKIIAGNELQIANYPGLAMPLVINGRLVGMVLLLDRAGAEAFSRDDIFLLEHLVPDILHVLERIELLRALEQSNRALNAEQIKQKALIEQLESAQGQLLQSEKMASVGQLAAGVAHEINNPIGYVYSNLNSLEKYVQEVFSLVDVYALAESVIADDALRTRITTLKTQLDVEFLKEDVQALMRESKEGIGRVKKIVQDLKDFSHVDASEEWNFANLQAGIDSTLNIVNNEIKYKADVIKEYGNIAEVECLVSQLNQVFMNLLVNAAQAIEERGTITVRTGKQSDAEVWIEVSDTGKGIAAENIKRIFDPFFTTKPVGKGTGLGLSLSYGIVQKHHGRIEVHSELGVGTTFRVYLPVQQPGPELAAAAAD